jgi:tetratricopeptide (TPR) repeat protein
MVGSRDAFPLAFVIAAVWVAHPALTNSVTYLSQRTECLMGLCYLLTLYSFIRSADSPRSRAWLISSITACCAGMAAKEVMITAPLMVLLYDVVFLAHSFSAALRLRRLYYGGLATTWLLLAYLLTTGLYDRHVGWDLGVDWSHYALTQSQAVLVYLRVILWPSSLVFDYGPTILQWRDSLPFVLITALLAVDAWFGARKSSWIAFLLCWFILILAPTSSFVPIALQPIAENRIYLPSIAIIALMIVGIHTLVGRGALAAFGALIVNFAWLSEQRNAIYQNPITLWRDTVDKRPQNSRALEHYGQTLQQAGRLNDAILLLERAIQLNPSSHTSLALLGKVLMATHRADEALLHLEHAVDLKPNVARYRNNLGACFAELNRIEAAIVQYRAAISFDAEFATAHSNLAGLLYRSGDIAAAAEHFHKALELDPHDSATQHDYGVMMLLLGRLNESIIYLRLAVDQHPQDTKARNTYGVALMRSNMLKEAAAQFEEVLQRDPLHHQARVNLDAIRLLQQK